MAEGGRPNKAEEFDRDYVGIAFDYATRAADEANKGRFSRWVRLAARRFLEDLKRTAVPYPPFTFDSWAASDPCDFIEKLPHVEGRWKDESGEYVDSIILHESDVFFIVQLFGFRNLEGGRRFTMALKAIARKNAKSTVAAAIGIYCEACEGEVGPQVISAATTGSQARIVFNIAKQMVEKTPDLRSAFALEPFANAIACYSNGGTFKPINAKASTQDGLNPSAAIIDEVHAHKTHDLLNVIQSAAGARENPLFLFTTTEGYESPGPWPELRHFMKQVLLGVVQADHFLCVYYTLDEDDPEAGVKGDDDFDESAWIKANPLIEVNSILLREIRKAAIEAKSMPGKLAELRTKRLNRPSAAARGWISYQHWQKCKGPVDIEAVRPFPCWGGLDLASTRDLVSFRLVWFVDGVLITRGRRYITESSLKQRTERGTIPYAGWVAAGYLTVIPGEIIDYGVVERDILDDHENFNIQLTGYDQWNASSTSKRLTEAGVKMRTFIQGPKSYHPAMKSFEELYMAGNFRHGDDPVLLWCASNLVPRTDANMNMAPDRKRSFEKIDDMVALLMAEGTRLGEQPEPPKEPSFFFT